MLNHGKIWLTACLLVAGYLLLSGAISADEKKKEEEKKEEKKKEETKSSGPVFSKTDELTKDDEKDTGGMTSGAPRKVYKVKLDSGKTYQIDLKSKEFDCFLRLEDPAGKEVASNDDFPGLKLDSRIIHKVVKGGEFRIIATSFDKQPGKFTVTVVEVAGENGEDKKPAVKMGDSIFQAKGQELKLKDGKARFSGSLEDTDASFGGKAVFYYKVFNVNLEGDQVYRIDYRSDDFDCYLFLEDAEGKRLAADDDSGGGLDSRIVYKIPKTGNYRVITTTLPAANMQKKTGKFVLEINPGNEQDKKEAFRDDAIRNFATISPKERRKLVQDTTKDFQDRSEDLTIKDAMAAVQLSMAVDDDVLPKLYKDLGKAFSNAADKQAASAGKFFTQSLDQLEKSQERIGKEIEITGMTLQGKEFDLKKLKGKVVLVDFWGTWCGPCVAEIPNVLKVYEQFHRQGFEVIGVARDKSDDTVIQFMESRKMPWPCLNIEDSSTMIKKHGVNSYPTVILVGPDGRVASVRARGPQLHIVVERLLNEKK